jgi:RNA polymerase sigma factor (sigma-70 family)
MIKNKLETIYFIERGTKSVDTYLAEINKLWPEPKNKKELTDKELAGLNKKQKEEEYNLWLKIQAGDIDARNELVERNLRYVVRVAKQYCWCGARLEDLIMAGNIGMIIAAENFDARLGCKFITYATWHIENEIRKTVNDHFKHGVSHFDTVDVSFLGARPGYTADWYTSMKYAYEAIKQGLKEKHFKGVDLLFEDYAKMMQQGLTTAEFKRKHHLTDREMAYFMRIVREEGKALLAA